MELIQFPFAAAGSLVTLPFLFSAETLIWYPVQSMIGLIFFMVLPILIFRNKTHPPKHRIYSLHKNMLSRQKQILQILFHKNCCVHTQQFYERAAFIACFYHIRAYIPAQIQMQLVLLV